jgi:hypothetical protein
MIIPTLLLLYFTSSTDGMKEHILPNGRKTLILKESCLIMPTPRLSSKLLFLQEPLLVTSLTQPAMLPGPIMLQVYRLSNTTSFPALLRTALYMYGYVLEAVVEFQPA